MNECIDSIFPHYLFLEECKRLKTQEDKDKLKSIYADIFEHGLSLHDVINKYFTYTDDITGTESNVAYLNNTCREVSRQIRKRQGKQNEFEVGEIMICREYRKTKTYKLNVNFRYEIINISDPWITIANIKTREEITLNIGFIFAFCYTCHSVQGCSIDDDVTIFDWNHHLITREWLWTGITRARDLNRVKFYKYSSDLNEEFNAKCIMKYFDRKVLAYKEQDRKNGFGIPKENYVDAEWLKDNVNGKCANCGCGFVLSMDSGNINSNLTCQRVCNDLPHTKDNVIAFCASCNRCFSDKITYRILFYSIIYMSDKDKIISEIYYDQAGFGSIATTYKDAKKKDASITMQDVKEWFQENVERKKRLSGYNSFIAPDINFEYQLDLFFISKNDLDNQNIG